MLFKTLLPSTPGTCCCSWAVWAVFLGACYLQPSFVGIHTYICFVTLHFSSPSCTGYHWYFNFFLLYSLSTPCREHWSVNQPLQHVWVVWPLITTFLFHLEKRSLFLFQMNSSLSLVVSHFYGFSILFILTRTHVHTILQFLPSTPPTPLNRCGLAQTLALGECFMRRQIRIFFKAPSTSSQKFYRNWKSHYSTPFQQQNEAKICSDKFPNETQLAVFCSIYSTSFSLTHLTICFHSLRVNDHKNRLTLKISWERLERRRWRRWEFENELKKSKGWEKAKG